MEDTYKKMVISYLEDNYSENIPKFKDYESCWILISYEKIKLVKFNLNFKY